MPFTTETIILFILGAFLVVIIGWLVWMEMRIKKFFRGKKAADLEQVLRKVVDELEGLSKQGVEFQKHFDDVERRLKQSVQHVGIVRFNPFADAGGDQSFAIALLDEGRNGVVISSLYGRESNRMYAKPVSGGTSDHQLSEEEKHAIKKALSSE